MKTYSKGSLVILIAVLAGALPLTTTGPVPAADPGGLRSTGLCAAVPSPMPLPAGVVGESGGTESPTAEVRAVSLPALLGTLGQLIVEAELSQAPVSGRFQSVINTAVAGSVVALEVCRETIAGAVLVADRPGLRFVIGDFNDDGATDVALQRPESGDWSVDLGVAERAAAATPRSRPGGSRLPGARARAVEQIARLAGGRRLRGAIPFSG